MQLGIVHGLRWNNRMEATLRCSAGPCPDSAIATVDREGENWLSADESPPGFSRATAEVWGFGHDPSRGDQQKGTTKSVSHLTIWMARRSRCLLHGQTEVPWIRIQSSLPLAHPSSECWTRRRGPESTHPVKPGA